MKYYIIIFCALLITSCSSGPKEINFGNDKCDYCTMTITDKPYATEVVTEKGKAYKFDSSECMFAYVNENSTVGYSQYLTSTMDKPGTLQDATQCKFLISPNLPSPMGANITAFSTKSLAEEAKQEFSGDVFSFDEIKNGHHHNQQNHQEPEMNHHENNHQGHMN